jgi:hypothetical protein
MTIRQSEESLELEFILTPEDQFRAFRSYYLRAVLRQTASLAVLLLAAAAVVGGMALLRGRFGSSQWLAMGFLAFAACWVAFRLWQRRPRRASFKPVPVRVSANQEGVWNKTPFVEQLSRWPAVTVVRALDYGLAVQTLGFRFFVPTRVFENRKQIEEAVSFLAAMRAKYGAVEPDFASVHRL